MIAALFVETGGPYFGLPNVDPWDIQRDARNYQGPHPVVAHPPCNLWVNFAALNFKRYGGDHNKPGNDGGCFKSALAAVRKYGGILEHPAGSRAWARFCLPRPVFGRWTQSRGDEYVTEVWQSVYGHKARKRTWLFAVSEREPAPMLWARKSGSHQCGWFDRAKPTLSKKEASATPVKFRDALISVAEACR